MEGSNRNSGEGDKMVWEANFTADGTIFITSNFTATTGYTSNMYVTGITNGNSWMQTSLPSTKNVLNSFRIKSYSSSAAFWEPKGEGYLTGSSYPTAAPSPAPTAPTSK